jgi:hypothetical protein
MGTKSEEVAIKCGEVQLKLTVNSKDTEKGIQRLFRQKERVNMGGFRRPVVVKFIGQGYELKMIQINPQEGIELLIYGLGVVGEPGTRIFTLGLEFSTDSHARTSSSRKGWG